jgi:hypothetical protein
MGMTQDDDKNRRVQPASGLVDDARKVAEAIREIGALPDVDADNRGWMARDALAIAESLPEKIKALEMDRDDARREHRRQCQLINEALAEERAQPVSGLVAVAAERDDAVASLQRAHDAYCVGWQAEHNRAKELESKLSALSRPMLVAVDVREPSEEAVESAIRAYHGCGYLAVDETSKLDMRQAIEAAYAIDFAPHVAAAYRRGAGMRRRKQ